MGRTLRWFPILPLVLVLFPGISAGKDPGRWYFPKPFTMSSPMAPPRSGGLEFSMNFADEGMGFAFPLVSTVSVADDLFIVDFGWPLAVGKSDASGSGMYGGNPRIGFLGSWRFLMPFGDGIQIPAAWAVGADLCVPLANLWDQEGPEGFAFGFPMYIHDWVGWMPEFGFRPKALLALGEPIFFGEFELTLPGLLVGVSGRFPRGETAVLLGWGISMGTQPLDWFEMMFEMGGVHDLTSKHVFMDDMAVWGAVSFRLTFGAFVTGGMVRFPFVRAYTAANEAPASLTLFFGYELRHTI